MDINGPSRFRHRKTPSSDRFLGAFPPINPPSAAAEENELNEDDIFSTGDFAAAASSSSPSSSSASSTPRRLHHKLIFPQLDSHGILAALPEAKPNSLNHHHLYQKTAAASPPTSSSSSASSARLIPSIPKPPQERFLISSSSSSVAGVLKHQSAPVNVPVLAMRVRRNKKDFDEIDEEEDGEEGGGDGEMLPPHEMVARANTPVLACSVLEGVGRTLKGRDLRQVRNAVWRQTGFLD